MSERIDELAALACGGVPSARKKAARELATIAREADKWCKVVGELAWVVERAERSEGGVKFLLTDAARELVDAVALAAVEGGRE